MKKLLLAALNEPDPTQALPTAVQALLENGEPLNKVQEVLQEVLEELESLDELSDALDQESSDESGLKDFPVERIKATSAGWRGSVIYNPFGGPTPPTLWYGIGIALKIIDLGDQAPAPELWGTELETELRLGGIVLPFRSWRDLDYEYGPVKDVGESSVYISGVHNPIDIERVRTTHIEGASFRIELDLFFAFEFDGSGFRNTRHSMVVEAEFRGVSFCVPQWSDPEEATKLMPLEWNIPTEFNDHTVRAFLERFVDTSEFQLERDGEFFLFSPRQ